MAGHYTSAHLLKTKTRSGTHYQGVLKYQEPNPEFIPDNRAEEQRRKSFGKRPNPDYVEDVRTAIQRKQNITKSVRRIFDTEAARKILNDPTAEAPRTKSDATRVLNAWREQMEAVYATPDASMTVAEYVADYITTRENQGRVEKSTIKDYRCTSRCLAYGGPAAIDRVIMRELTPKQVQAWESALAARGLSGTTQLKAHRLLKQVCKYAVEIDDLPKSPVRGFDAPSRSTGKPNALDAEGRRRAMLVLDAMGPTAARVGAELALYAGLRRGEICALTWGNVDLVGVEWADADELGPKLRVSQSFGSSTHGRYLKTPKTEKGRRVIPLQGGIVDTLKARRAAMWAEWSEDMRKAGHTPTKATFSTLYVIGWENGEAFNMDRLSKQWHKLASDAELVGTQGRVVTLHDLRHTAATMLITRGVDVSTVADVLGHREVVTTLRAYVSKDGAAKRRAAMIAASDLDAARAGDVLPFMPTKTGTEG